MNAPASASALRWLAAALAMLGIFWMLAWTSLAALLARDANARLASWQSGATPWHWSLYRPGTVVWPGSSGFERTDEERWQLLGRLPQGSADLSLALQGRALDLSLLRGAVLRAYSEETLHAELIAETPTGALTLGSAPLDPPGGLLFLPFAITSDLPAHSLRLHLVAPPEARIGLAEVTLVRRPGLAPEPCQPEPDLQLCNADVPLVGSPGFLRPEALLQWRDEWLRLRPAAIILPTQLAPLPVPFVDIIHAAATQGPAWPWILPPLLAVLLSRLRPVELRGRMLPLLELGLVFGPWLLLQWAGLPTDKVDSDIAQVFPVALLAALLLRDPAPYWRFIGDRDAWFATGRSDLALLLLLLCTVLANLFDADGLTQRPLANEKFWQYPLWALLQQWLLIRAIAPRLRECLHSEAGGALFAGALFGLLHLPNLSLMLATWLGGSVWAWLGYRYRALLPLALSHAALGLALIWLAPPWLLRSAEVGGRYLMTP